MKFLTSPNIWFGALLLAAAAGTGFYWQRVSSLRRENQALELQLQGAGKLSAEGLSINEMRAENAEVHRLKTETRDLHKLRNEVRQLREQTKDLDGLRAENERLTVAVAKLEESPSATSAAPRPSYTLEQLQNSGQATPEATLVTMFWAMKQGDPATAARCWSSDEAGKFFNLGTPDDFSRQSKNMANGFGELRIAGERIISAEEVLLGVQMLSKGYEIPEEFSMPFRRIGGEWKLSPPSR
ncbi:MAG: hypothetical protein O2960_08970 [Verrucomicrobia bacterium]|nr:hypothetical protein [Verrucomicrobiota bacterium]